MKIRKRKRKRIRPSLKNKKKFKRGSGFWTNLQKGINNAYGYSGFY